MIYLFVFGFVLLFIFVVPFRVVILNPFKVFYFGIKDIYSFFKYKKYNICPFPGTLTCYSAHFGGGKTLSGTEYICRVFKRYNNKRVFVNGRFVTQKINIISNVHLIGTPYIDLKSLSQVVDCAFNNKTIDSENFTHTVTIVFIDEASALLNSRDFKNNFTPMFLNSLLTCRHYSLGILYTSQKFKLTDALLRSVTQNVINCKKYWRILVQHYYDADQVELASDTSLIKPYKSVGLFVTDKIYNQYDTLAVVGDLKRRIDNDDMMSEAEILQMRNLLNPDDDSITSPSRKLKKRRKRA